jgi:PAS domain S-box-containing protein
VQQEPAVVVLRADGSYVDANPAALEIFGVSREVFLASTGEDWAVEPTDASANDAFREQWQAAGQPDLGGETTIVRRDGSHRRVRFVIAQRDADQFVAILEPLPDAPHEPTVVFTAGTVLAEWRAAERRLEAVPSDSAEWQATAAQIDNLRQQYHRLFEARRG